MVWTGIAVVGAIFMTLSPQGIRLLEEGAEGNTVVKNVLSLVITHVTCALPPAIWWFWRGYVRESGWKIRRRYDAEVYRPPRRSLRWYAAAIGLSVVIAGVFQFCVVELHQQGRPLSIAVMIGKIGPFLLTLWDVRRSKWFPVIGAVQVVGAAIALEFFVAGDSFGVVINPDMVAALPLVLALLAPPVAGVAGRWVERRLFREEHEFLAEHLETEPHDLTQEEASLLTAKLLTLIHVCLVVFYGACFLAAGWAWGFPAWQDGWEWKGGIAIFVLCGIANTALIASSIHGRMALFAIASAATLMFAYLWNRLFQGLPFTREQQVGSLIVLLGLAAAAWVEKRALGRERDINDGPDPVT